MVRIYAYLDLSLDGNVDDACNMFVSFDSMETFKRFDELKALDDEEHNKSGFVLLDEKKHNCGIITAEDLECYKEIDIAAGTDAAYEEMNLGDELWDTLTEYAYCVDMVDTYGEWDEDGNRIEE